MRPRSIVLFDWLYLGSLVASLVASPFTYRKTLEATAQDPAMAQLSGGMGYILIGSLAFGFVISLVLWFFVSRRASNVARWLVVAFTALGVLGLIQTFVDPVMGAALNAVTAVLTLMQVAASIMLLRKDARDWFDGKGPVNPDVFS